MESVPSGRARPVFLIVVLALAGCSSSAGSSGSAGLALAPVTSGASATPLSTPAATTPTTPALDAVPVVLVHGVHADPDCWDELLVPLGRGRVVVRELYAAEADVLASGSLPPDTVVSFGYYKESARSAKYDPDPQGLSHGSIGGCPVSRHDGLDRTYYTVSYADRLRRCVEGLRRATGCDRVDLVCHSMGGIVGRAYTKWLSVGPGGRSAVRNLFLIASPGRGVNALEESIAALSQTGPIEFCRLGEALELSYEGTNWGGRSYIEQLNDGWDSFTAAHGIRYAGVSLLGTRAVAAGSPGSATSGTAGVSAGAGSSPGPTAPGTATPAPAATPVPAVTPAPIAAPAPTTPAPSASPSGLQKGIQSLLATAKTLTPAQWSQFPLLPIALRNLLPELAEALGPNDGMVRFESVRLDRPPFLAAAFHGLYEGSHGNRRDPERSFESSYVVDAIRDFCLENRAPATPARSTRLALATAASAGRRTFLVADVGVTGDGPLAVQLVEETLDAAGNVAETRGYGAPVRAADQRIGFFVSGGGGTRRYRLVAYGPAGPIGVQDGVVFVVEDGVPEAAPLATIAATVRPGVGAPSVHVTLGSNARANDPALRYRVRLDAGAWSAPSATDTFDSPPLAPGLHRIEVVAQSASNGAGVTVEQGLPTAVGLLVEASGTVRVLP